MYKVKIIEETDYPINLKNIEKPPRQLYYKGNIELLKKPIISVIGSRSCSKNGSELAFKFAAELAQQGIVIASGMAKGIDTAAHNGALQAGGKTIAVLGNGFENIFPKENQNLYEEIIQKGGLVLTEYPPETKSKSEYFLERNRIVSGIAIGILVIEAQYRSGTSVTAKIAKEQRKKVFALPHEIHDKLGIGTNKLIQNGAILVTSVQDIIKQYTFLEYKKTKEIRYEQNNKLPNKKYQEIYKLLTKKPYSLNEIYLKLNKSKGEINEILLMLELEGYIIKTSGGYQCTKDVK